MRRVDWNSRASGGNRPPGGGKSRKKGRVPQHDVIQLPVEAPARGGGGGKAAIPTVSRRSRKAW